MISPAGFGAHVVVHSMTKYIGGASDIIAGDLESLGLTVAYPGLVRISVGYTGSLEQRREQLRSAIADIR